MAVRVRPAKKEEGEEKKPYLTELIESLYVPVEKVQEENRKHLDWSMKKAEAQLLFQDAQKPPAHRFKFPAYVSTTNAQCSGPVPSAQHPYWLAARCVGYPAQQGACVIMST